MHEACVLHTYLVMIKYVMLDYNYAQYKPSCMCYTVTYHHDASFPEAILHR